jgi:predicted RNA-binding protein with PUA-like domain
MRPGDRVFIYHSGGQPAVAGLATVGSEPRPDPANPKSVVVEFQYLAHLDPPTPLADIKSAGKFDEWSLVRQGRLSTMEAPQEFINWMRARYPDVQI